MGWRDYNVGKVSAIGRFRSCGVKQIFEEQDTVKMDKDVEKARQLRLSNLDTSVISGSVSSVLCQGECVTNS